MISLRRIAIQMLVLSAFMLASAACALAQAEINPDHFDDAAQQTLKKTSATSATHAKINYAFPKTTRQTSAQSRTATEASVQPASKNAAPPATAHHASNTRQVPHTGSDKHKKQLVSEAHSHGAP